MAHCFQFSCGSPPFTLPYRFPYNLSISTRLPKNFSSNHVCAATFSYIRYYMNHHHSPLKLWYVFQNYSRDPHTTIVSNNFTSMTPNFYSDRYILSLLTGITASGFLFNLVPGMCVFLTLYLHYLCIITSVLYVYTSIEKIGPSNMKVLVQLHVCRLIYFLPTIYICKPILELTL